MVVVVGGRYCRVLQQLTMHTGHLVGDKMCEQDILRGNYREMPINSVFRLSIKSVVVEFKRPHTHEKETFFHPPIHSKGETIKQSQFTVN